VEFPKMEYRGSKEEDQEDDCCWERRHIFPKIIVTSVCLELCHIQDSKP
jgi:hypothetical protein